MDISWIGIALVFGILAKKLQQPPLLGFLVAGFTLAALDIQPGAALEDLARRLQVASNVLAPFSSSFATSCRAAPFGRFVALCVA